MRIRTAWLATIAVAAALVLPAVGVGGLGATNAGAASPSAVTSPTPIYDSTAGVNAPLLSQAFDATQTSEFGNEITFAPDTPRYLSQVTATVDSWACQTGAWNVGSAAGPCVTTPGANFTMPLTLTVYNVGEDNAVGSVIATTTQNFAIPYRPSPDTTNCTGGNAGMFLVGGVCTNGQPANVTFNFPGSDLMPDSVIYGISFNTSDYGSDPYGDNTACFAAGDCPYDALNVAVNTAATPSLGTDPLPGTAFLDSEAAGSYCDSGTAGTGTFRLDSPTSACWAPTPGSSPYYIPAAQFVAIDVPGAPVGPTAAPAPSNGAVVNWSPPSADGGSAITGYTVTPTDTTSDMPGTPVTVDGSTTTATVTGLNVGDNYTFAVTASNVAGPGPAATSNSVTILGAPSAPVSPTASISGVIAGNAVVSWSPPTSNGGSPVTSYTVTPNDTTTGTTGTPVTVTATATTVTGLNLGDTYTFSVTATNAAGTGPAATSNSVTIPGKPTAPSAPVSPTATTSGAPSGGAIVSWSPPTSTGGSTITGYTVTPNDITTGTTGTPGSAAGTATIATIKALKPGNTYTFSVTATNAAGTGPAATSNSVVPLPIQGNWLVASDGGIFTFGNAGFFGSEGDKPLNKPIVGMASTPDGGGYWMVASDGGIFTFGDAGFYGSKGGSPLNEPIVGMASTPDGGGYWLVASDGGIFTFGDAGFYGSKGGSPLNEPIVGMASTPDGGGYWLVASDGGIFTFGDAGFYGSKGGSPLNEPIVGMASTPDGGGYWLVASDGGIFTFGDAGFYGSKGGSPLNEPIVGMASTPDGGGYWLVASDGGIFTFGDATFYGSEGGAPLNKPIVGMASTG